MQAGEKCQLDAGPQLLQSRRLELPEPQMQPLELRRIVREASRALALLDAVRLEELALACHKLNRDLASQTSATVLPLQVEQASAEMAVFARVLDATRANLVVIRRLRDLREGRLEYNASAGDLHGHN